MTAFCSPDFWQRIKVPHIYAVGSLVWRTIVLDSVIYFSTSLRPNRIIHLRRMKTSFCRPYSPHQWWSDPERTSDTPRNSSVGGQQSSPNVFVVMWFSSEIYSPISHSEKRKSSKNRRCCICDEMTIRPSDDYNDDDNDDVGLIRRELNHCTKHSPSVVTPST